MRLLTCVCSLIYYPCSYVYCHLWALASALCSHARAHACAHMFLHPCPCSHMCVGFHVLSSVMTPFFFLVCSHVCALTCVLSNVCSRKCALMCAFMCVVSCVFALLLLSYSYSNLCIFMCMLSYLCVKVRKLVYSCLFTLVFSYSTLSLFGVSCRVNNVCFLQDIRHMTLVEFVAR